MLFIFGLSVCCYLFVLFLFCLLMFCSCACLFVWGAQQHHSSFSFSRLDNVHALRTSVHFSRTKHTHRVIKNEVLFLRTGHWNKAKCYKIITIEEEE